MILIFTLVILVFGALLLFSKATRENLTRILENANRPYLDSAKPQIDIVEWRKKTSVVLRVFGIIWLLVGLIVLVFGLRQLLL